MNLTIIIPVLNNKELIRAINKRKDINDEIITLRVTSNNVRDVIQSNIDNCIHDNILIINPRDSSILSNDFINSFKKSGLIANNISKKTKLAHSSSLKFDRKQLVLSPGFSPKNIFEFMQYIFRYYNNDYVNSNQHEDAFMDIKNIPESPFTNKPKILMLCDVKGWAWWIKSQYLKQYLDSEFDIDVVNLIGKDARGFNKNKYDLYFTFGYSYVNNLKGVPFKKTITGVTAHRDKNKIAPQLRRANALHANSMLLYNEFKDINKNIFYVPNGVDHELFYPRKESDILERDYINIGHVGKKAKLKQQETVIEPVVKKLGDKFKYIYHYNNYMDKVPHTEMPKLYTDMDLFIVASLEDGTPNGALEAMASGVPVIGNRIGNLPELIQNGYNGYIIEQPTINNYVKLIENLDKEHLIEMGKNARQTILNNWTWAHKAENYRHLFRSILKKNGY